MKGKRQTKRTNSRFVFRFALGLLLGSFSGGVLFAQTATSSGTRLGSTEITLFAGISAPVGHESNGFALEVNTGTPMGGRVSYNFDGHNAAEFSIANPFSLSANYVYNFSAIRGKWAPYVTAGIGGARGGILLTKSKQPAPKNSKPMGDRPPPSTKVFTANSAA